MAVSYLHGCRTNITMRMIIYVTFFKCRYIPVLLITLFLFFLLYSCTGSTPDIRLERISQTVSLHPDSALAALKSINKKELNEANRHYYDFLYIKACDKAYIMHKNDSLILDVIDYYSRHNRRKLYGEALYYGGRVYSDLGDSPTALDYFHKALDETEGDPSKIELRTRIYSQGGRLLGNMKMYTEAAGFIKEALQLELEMHPLDTLSYFYDLQLLGETYSFAGKLEQADSVLNLALHYEGYVPDQDICMSYITLADNCLKNGDFCKAADYLNVARKYVSNYTLNSLLLSESNLYHANGDDATAYAKVNEIIHNSDPLFKVAAYSSMLTPELIKYIPPDSIPIYYEKYRIALNKRYKDSDAQMVVIQQAQYNYLKHLRDSINSKKHQRKLSIAITFLAFILICGLFYTVVRRIKHKHTLNELKNALDNVVALKRSQIELSRQLEMLTKLENSNNDADLKQVTQIATNNNSTLQKLDKDLRIAMREKLLRLSTEFKENGTTIPIANEIVQSEVYKTLKNCAERNNIVLENSPIWKDLYSLVIKVSPDFSEKLATLLGGDIRSYDQRTCLLMKCGFGTKQISIIEGRSVNTISTRKNSISSRIFDTPHGPKGIETIIQLL